MKTISMSAVVVMWCAMVATAQDTSHAAAKEQTLAGWHEFQALHLDLGGESVPGSGKTTTLAVAQLTMAFTRLPGWSFGLVNGSGYGGTTDYVVAGSDGFRPEMSESVTGLDIERRWGNRRGIHPVAGVSVGSITNSFEYSVFHGDSRQDFADEKKSRAYATLKAGAEGNIARWLRFSVSAGYRMASSYRWSNGSVRSSGVTVTSLFELGKF